MILGGIMEEHNRSKVQRKRKPSNAPHSTTNPCNTPEGDLANSQKDSLQQLMTQLGELREYSAYFVRAKIDRFKLTLRRAATLSLLIVLATFAAFATVFVSVWLLLFGLAEGVGSILGGRVWLGNVIVAIVVLSSVSVTGWLLSRRRARSEYSKTAAEYERRQQDQKAKYGHSVQERAQSARTRDRTSTDNLEGQNGSAPGNRRVTTA
jgi:hypothetical protein